MNRVLIAAIYALSNKQTRSTIIQIVVAILCIPLFVFIMFQGFASTYITALGGTHNDTYSQAVYSVKEELQISNDLEPSYLRMIYLKQGKEPTLNELVKIIKDNFIFSKAIERTITEEDISNMQKSIDELKQSITDEGGKTKPDEDVLNELENELSELEKSLSDFREIYLNETGDEYFFFSSYELDIILSSEPFNLTSDDINEVNNYLLLAVSTSNVSSDYDFSNIKFTNENVTEIQNHLVNVALESGDYGIVPGYNQCEKWVEDVYQASGLSRSGSHCAACAGSAYGVSADWKTIQVGATVYGTASQMYGHVGIYLGEGLVIHNLSGKITVQSLESWVKDFNGKCWGWDNAQNLSGNPEYDCVGNLM